MRGWSPPRAEGPRAEGSAAGGAAPYVRHGARIGRGAGVGSRCCGGWLERAAAVADGMSEPLLWWMDCAWL